MTNVSMQSCDYSRDQNRLVDFLVDYRAFSNVLVYRTAPWRVRLLWSSRVREPEADAGIWQEDGGRMLAFAMLWSRDVHSSYIVLDGFIHPQSAGAGMIMNILQWGERRARQIVEQQGKPLVVYANGFSEHPHARVCLEQRGFTPTPADPSGHNLYFVRSLTDEIPSPQLPAGCSIRSLREDEAESYQALYGFSPVSPLHFQETLASDEYAHLVAVDPAGGLAAYCEYSICRAEWEKTQHRIGWIEYIGTSLDHQRMGFGRAILLRGLQRLKTWGADSAALVTIHTNIPAVNLYTTSGFEVTEVAEPQPWQKSIV